MDKQKRYREKIKLKKILHEKENGSELGYPGVRISDFIKGKVLSGKTQILIVDKKVIQFHKDCNTGYWVNNTQGTLRLHREKLRLELGLTKEQMKNYDVHHIDGNKDNNDISNLQLINKIKHVTMHAEKQVQEKIIKICEGCGEEYESSSNIAHRQRFCSEKCKMRWRRANGVNKKEERVCLNCGELFTCEKSTPTKFCSRHCAGVWRYETYESTRKCNELNIKYRKK